MAAADLDLDLAGLDCALADRQAHRAAEQFGVGELLARAGVTVVVDHFHSTFAKALIHALGRGPLGRCGLPDRD